MTDLAFIIDPKASTDADLLVIRLGEFRDGKPLPLGPSPLANLKSNCSMKEKEILDFLVKEELLYQTQLTKRAPHATTHPFQFFHISLNQVIPALKLIAPTQKLYFNNKQLVADFFGKVDFYYRIESLPDQKIEVQGRLKWRDKDIELKECDWVGGGKPPYFIHGITLKMVSTDVSWKSLKPFSKGPLILSGIEKSAFLDDLDTSDPDAPLVVYAGTDFKATTSPHEPLPFLLLRDRLGAFADLWMDYGNGIRIPYNDSILSPAPKFKRHQESEKNWERDLLETDFIKKISGTSHYYCPLDKVAKSLTFLLEVGWQIEDAKGNRVVKTTGINLNMDETEKAISIKGKVRFDQYQAEVGQLIKAYRHGERFFQLSDGSVGLLPSKWEQTELQELADEGEIVGEAIHVKRSHLGAVSGLFKSAEIAPSLSALKERLVNFERIEEAAPGRSFQGQLRPYQQQGLNWLSFLWDYGFHGILADDMGLGKTIQILALLSKLPLDRPHLIVVPTSLLFNWKNEIEKFLPGIGYTIHQGQQRTDRPSELLKNPLILTSYTTLRLDLPLFQSLLFSSLILDEAQVIKNAHTQTAQALCSLNAQLRISITGTPIENHLSELWSHFRFLIPDLLGDEETFEADLQAAQSDNRYLQRIKRKVAPFVLRRKKEDVLKDLPERIDQIVWVEMSPDQRQAYQQFLAGVKSNLLKKVDADGIGKHRVEIFEAILRLRQICCHPALVSLFQEDLPNLSSAKFDAVLDDLETIREEGSKVLIYSQFTSLLHLLSKAAQQRQWGYAYLDGSTVNREKVVSSFQEDPSIQFFFISLKAGGVGLNLTAADYVLLYDPWWNEAVEDQAISRAHRLGRTKTVIAKRYVTRESIEEKMMTLKAQKRQLIGEVFDLEEQALNLTMDDFRMLLS